MKVRCAFDDQWHNLSPTALAIVVEAFQEGELQRIHKPFTISTVCILEALTEERLEAFGRRYPGHTITATTEERTTT